MDALHLFAPDPEANVATARRRHRAPDWDDVAHRAEMFLVDHLEPEGDLAMIQATLSLCEATGTCDAETLADLPLDPSRFPRSLAAVERTRELLGAPVAERPEGFWPRFLLEQFEGSAA